MASCASTNHVEDTEKKVTKPSRDEAAALADLLDRHWEHMMVTNPVWATRLGDHRYDDRVGDASAEGIAKNREATRAFLAEAKQIDGSALEREDRTTLLLFTAMLQSSVDSEVCRFEEWTLSARGNPVTEWNYLPESHPIEDYVDATNYVARVQAAGEQIDNERKNLEHGAEAKLFANAESVRRVRKMVADQLAKPVEEWPLMKPAKTHPQIADSLKKAVEEGVKPALARYGETLEKKIAPNARSSEQTGLGALPFGKACYEARIRAFTGLPLTAEEIHETGKQEIARINGEMQKLGEKIMGTSKLPEVLEKLRKDEALHFASEEEIVKKAEDALAKARAAMPKYFGVLPKADCVVRRIPEYEAPFTTVAYYRQPVPDGSKARRVLHQRVPAEDPAEVRDGGALVPRGDPGPSPADRDRAGAPRDAAVPETHRPDRVRRGLGAVHRAACGRDGSVLRRRRPHGHAQLRSVARVAARGGHGPARDGWSRDQAKKYMLEHTALAANNIDNEVDGTSCGRARRSATRSASSRSGASGVKRRRSSATASTSAAFTTPCCPAVRCPCRCCESRSTSGSSAPPGNLVGGNGVGRGRSGACSS